MTADQGASTALGFMKYAMKSITRKAPLAWGTGLHSLRKSSLNFILVDRHRLSGRGAGQSQGGRVERITKVSCSMGEEDTGSMS